MGTDEEYLAAVKDLDEMKRLLSAEREARQRAEYERDKAIACTEQAEERHRQQVAWAQACENERLEVQTRAEQAERDRDETLSMWREYKAAKDVDVASADTARERAEATAAELREQVRTQAESLQHLQERLTRAEADNAALVDALAFFRDCKPIHHRVAYERAAAVLSARHPGVALLEYVRALEKVREAVEPYRFEAAHYVGLADGSSKEEALVDACAAADALKTGRES